ncbi:MAG: hypothetical protein Kow0069_08870 [Promethearchaeota archaeon]
MFERRSRLRVTTATSTSEVARAPPSTTEPNRTASIGGINAKSSRIFFRFKFEFNQELLDQLDKREKGGRQPMDALQAKLFIYRVVPVDEPVPKTVRLP